MASKTISVTEEVYDLLKKVKLPNESFGDTIRRFIQNYSMRNLREWYESNSFEPLTDEEANEMSKTINEFRTGFRPQQVEFDDSS
ncbi:MAG: antitoxin VapB family protein [Promethearchaeota archaeon]